ncbi:MAG: hypothetical protein NTY01_14190 [Verrucomicrobia bacterium]|nr:hypothetical protein [Verrucomicrobiota bacterium]
MSRKHHSILVALTVVTMLVLSLGLTPSSHGQANPPPVVDGPVGAPASPPKRLVDRNEIATWSDRVEKELRILKLTSPGSVKLVVDKPDAVHVVQVSCDLAKFGSDEKEALKQWVRNGGIVWANNDVVTLFEAQCDGLFGGNPHDSTPACVPQICPIILGCQRVLVTAGGIQNLSGKGVVPLLTSSSTRGIVWSLLPYGKGWVSDVKVVENLEHGDGKRFWLHFRMFCLGWKIPGA